MAFQIKYQLAADELGWAEATLTFDSLSIAMRVSYLHDTLSLLAAMALRSVESFACSEVPFANDPGTHWCVFHQSNDEVRITLYEDTEVIDHVPRPVSARLIVATTETSRVLAANILGILHEHYTSLGLLSYSRSWRHDFPLHAYLRLRMQLDRSDAANDLRHAHAIGGPTTAEELVLLAHPLILE